MDEALRGYYTKYDCSAADVNPIGGASDVSDGRMDGGEKPPGLGRPWNTGMICQDVPLKKCTYI